MPCETMLNRFYVPLLQHDTSCVPPPPSDITDELLQAHALWTVAAQERWCEKRFDNEKLFADDGVCKTCEIQQELVRAVSRAGLADEYVIAANRFLDPASNFKVPLGGSGRQNELVVSVFGKARADAVDIKNLGEYRFGFKEDRTIRTTESTVKSCGHGEVASAGFQYRFGDEVVKEIIRQYVEERRRGHKVGARERISVDCLHIREKPESSCGACESSEA